MVRWLLLLCLLVIPAQSWAAVANDGTAIVTDTDHFDDGILNLTGKTTAGSDRCEIVHVGYEGTVPVTATATSNGVAMTLVVQHEVAGTAAGDIGAMIFRSPAGTEPGTASHNVVVTFDANVSRAIGAVSSYSGCDRSGTFNSVTGSGTTNPSLTVSTGVGADTMVVDAFILDDAATVGANQTQVLNLLSAIGGDYLGVGSYQDGADAGAMTWTASSSAWVGVAVNIPATGGAPPAEIFGFYKRKGPQ